MSTQPRFSRVIAAAALLLCWLAASTQAEARICKTLWFSGYQWQVKCGKGLGPGPNNWSADHAWVDADGYLHLKIARINGSWHSAEVNTLSRFGFGRYQFQVIGELDKLDRNVVLGMFNYPPADVGPDATNEIDIEIAQWGNADNPRGNFTVWPALAGRPHSTKTFPIALSGTHTTHRFVWRSDSVFFQSLHGHRSNDVGLMASRDFRPANPLAAIPQQPMPVFINFWLHRGNAPVDGKAAEVVIRRFSHKVDAAL